MRSRRAGGRGNSEGVLSPERKEQEPNNGKWKFIGMITSEQISVCWTENKWVESITNYKIFSEACWLHVSEHDTLSTSCPASAGYSSNRS